MAHRLVEQVMPEKRPVPSALPYALALLGLLIIAIALDFMRRAGVTHPEIKTAGAAFVATGLTVLAHVANGTSSRKR